MVIDTSALAAIFLNEADGPVFEAAMDRAERMHLSAVNFVEAGMVLESRLGLAAVPELDRYLELAGVEIVAVDRAQAVDARQAWRRYGKGRHAARLNLGDCFAYALARQLAEPLLYKGHDFGMTDIPSALIA